jgi:hypothetical protein
MDFLQLHGVALAAGRLTALLVTVAFYFLIIGVLELGPATISLGAFIALGIAVWTRPDRRAEKGETP